MATTTSSSFENVLEGLGVPGKFQILQITLILFGKTFVNFIALAFVFMGYEPPHVCNSVNETNLLENHGLANDSSAWIRYDSCHIKIYTNKSNKATEIAKMACPNGRNFSNLKSISFISEWDLVCESKGTAELVETFQMLTGIISGFMITSISDRFGRKPVLFWSSVAVWLLEIAVIFSTNIYMVMGNRLVSGFAYQGVICTYFVMCVENVVPRHRQAVGVVVCLVWIFNVLSFGGIAYGLQYHNWRYLQSVTASSGLVCVIVLYFLKEALRWLAAVNNRKKSLEVLKYACKLNRVSFELVKKRLENFWEYNDKNKKDSDILIQEKDKYHFEVKVEKNKATIFTLLNNKRLLRMTFLTCFIWITNNVTYYGLFMASSTISGNRFLNFTLMSLVEIPSYIVVLVMLNKMKRKTVLAIFLGLSAAFLMASSLLLTVGDDSSATNTLSTVFFILGKFAIGSSFGVIFIMTPELYPTNLRTIGYGMNNGGGKIGAMLAPFSRPLFTMAKWAPGLIFTIMCVISLIMIIWLPETKDKDLPNRVDDITRKSKKKNKGDGHVVENDDVLMLKSQSVF